VTPDPTPLWPWLALAGLGAFHGLNPAMGWLFAVALGLHRSSRGAVLSALPPIALGHAAAVAATLAVLVGFGFLFDPRLVAIGSGALLIGWAIWHLVRGHARRVRIGMTAGLAGLTAWSFLMAVAHGAGLMLVAVALPLCLTGTPGAELTASGSATIALAALGVHTAAMLATIAAVALVVYEWAGLGFLRRGWINLDLLWSAAPAASGALLILTA
jgi:hypothetical protein